MWRTACRFVSACVHHNTYLHVSSSILYVDNILTNVQAYVGFASDINAIVVVFRGTQENR